MSKKSLVVVFLAVGAAFALSSAAAAPQKAPGGPVRDQASHLERGLASFERGFYEFLPKNRRAEAEAAFDAAVLELGLALEAEPGNAQAHKAMARICAVRKDHLAAAEHYRRLTEIDPFAVDAYVLAADSLAWAGRFTEARTELERAKGRTADPRALALLDAYIGKLDEAAKKGGDGR